MEVAALPEHAAERIKCESFESWRSLLSCIDPDGIAGIRVGISVRGELRCDHPPFCGLNSVQSWTDSQATRNRHFMSC